MTAKSNHAIVIAMLSDWLQISCQFFNQREVKAKPITPRPYMHYFSCYLSKLQVIAVNSDWS